MSWQDAVAEIELRILELQKHLYSLRKQRNSMLPICRLPNELLERILLTLQESGRCNDVTNDNHYMLERFDACTFTWVRAMHVCSHLRAVALGSKVLWSKMNMMKSISPSWIKLCLERSGTHPLTLKGSLSHWRADDARARGILDVFSRCQHVQLTLAPLDPSYYTHDGSTEYTEECPSEQRHDCAFYELDKHHLHEHNPKLLSLEIHNHLSAASDWQGLYLDNTFLGGSSCAQVNLTRLVLCKVTFQSVPLMSSLRQLILMKIDNDLGCRRLREVLLRTPRLSYLRIEDPIDLEWDSVDFPEDIPLLADSLHLDLPQLTSLHLSGGIAQVPQIMELCAPLEPTNSSEIEIHIKEKHPGRYRNIPAYTAHMALVSPRVQDRIAHYLSAMCQGNYTLSCELKPHLDFDHIVLTLTLICPHSRRQCQGERPWAFSLICEPHVDLVNILSHVTSIRLGYWSNPFAYAPIDVLRRTNNLQELILANVDSGNIDELEADLHASLQARASVQARPLERVMVKYHKRDREKLENPSGTVWASSEKKWKAAGWVSNVEWELCHSKRVLPSNFGLH